MDAGALDRRVTILRAVATDDGFATVLAAPAPIGTVSASKQDMSDAERFRAGLVSASMTTRFRVRSTAFTRSIRPADLLRCAGMDYDIIGIKEVGRLDGLEITATAKSD